MKNITKNKIIILFEEDHDIYEILSMYNISFKELKKVIKEFVYTYSLSKIDINAYSTNFINEVKEQFKTGLSVKEIASKYNMSDYDIAYIVHMIYNKKYIYFLTSRTKSIEPYYMIRLSELGFTYSEIAIACGCSRDNIAHRIGQYKDKLKRKETKVRNVDQLDIEEIVDLFENYYSIKYIVNKFNVPESKIKLALKRYYPDRKNLYNTMPASFVKQLLDEGLTAEEIAEKYSRDLSYIEKIIANIKKEEAKEKARKAKETAKRYIDDQKEKEEKKKTELENKIIKLYLSGKYTLVQIAEELCLDYTYVCNVKKKHLKSKRVPDVTALIELIKQGYSNEEIYKMSNGTNIILNDDILKNAHEVFENTPQIK